MKLFHTATVSIVLFFVNLPRNKTWTKHLHDSEVERWQSMLNEMGIMIEWLTSKGSHRFSSILFDHLAKIRLENKVKLTITGSRGQIWVWLNVNKWSQVYLGQLKKTRPRMLSCTACSFIYTLLIYRSVLYGGGKWPKKSPTEKGAK